MGPTLFTAARRLLCIAPTLLALLLWIHPSDAMAQGGLDRRGRLGVGLSNQLKTDQPSLSLKLQQSQSFSLGALFSANTADDGGLGVGVKMHRNFFQEPHLVFYGALMAAYLSDKRGNSFVDVSGFQVDLTFGSEFHFQGLQSVGFHFDFGVSLNKLDDFTFETVGSQFLVMGVHFYL
jgi:hypothetical protein